MGATQLAEAIGGDDLGAGVRGELAAHPLPSDAVGLGEDDVAALQDAYGAEERTVLTLAAALDGR
ncbi:hypothetical protein DSM104299_02890 [Baekduia alba]|uniref:hypothetical protein n=1 Tax=Baekduia alba TaxID=2997333 RepID=UPI0023415D11|nr:hypothetical protein [Baekduia alba]WCB94161.1 hypothetical protein DSM104299_02890 [Baekduia alba]